MKRVVKSAEPQVFTEWKEKANDDWQPSYGTLQNPEKRALHEALIAEQGYVCCYCGRTISLTDSHIEHFLPQEDYGHLALEYVNLHASCIRELEPGAPLHCGHAKGSDLDEEKCISPVAQDCEQRFMYSRQDGAIYPTDKSDGAAVYMAELLKLDLRFLRDRRTAVLKSVFDDQFMSSASNHELNKLIEAYRRPDADGRVVAFGHVLARYAEQMLAD